MDRDELRDFLLGAGLSETVAQAVHDQNLDGQTFVRVCSKAELREIAADDGLEDVLTTAVILDLVNLRDRVDAENVEALRARAGGGRAPVARSAAGRGTRKALDEEEAEDSIPRAGAIARQIERSFGQPASDSKGYTWGNFLKQEIGVGSNVVAEPAREYKRLDFSRFKSIKDAEVTFVERIYEFCFGCLNARCNGTIFFGVEDGNDNRTYHGHIRGHFLTPQDMKALQDMLENNLTRTDGKLLQGLPEEEVEAICCSIKSLQFVPVNKGVPRKEQEKASPDASLYVIELDVEPETKWCKNMLFKISVGRDGAKGNRKKKNKKKSPATLKEFTYFYRDGNQTISFKESDRAKMARLERAVVRRKHHEDLRDASCLSQDMSKRLISTLSLNRSSGFPNSSIRYALLVNELDTAAGGEEDVLEWVRQVDWFMIFEFGDAVYNALRATSIRSVPSIHAESLNGLRNEDVTQHLYRTFAQETAIHVRCTQQDSQQSWGQTVGLGLTKLIGVASDYDEDAMEEVVLVTLIGTHCHLEYMGEVLKKFGEVMPVSHMACLYQNASNLNAVSGEVERFFGPAWRRQTFRVNWMSLNHHLLKVMGQTNENEHLLPSSSGSFRINSRTMKHLLSEGITVVPSDICDHVNKMSETEIDIYVEKWEKDIERYLKGTVPPPWILFHIADVMKNPGSLQNRLTKGLVHRDITDEILAEVQKIERGTENIVARLPIVHVPSSGATTIARNLLWKLKDTRRCVIIDGNHIKDNLQKLQTIARSLLNVRELGERKEVVEGLTDDVACPTVILLFDNCQQNMAKLLTAHVEKVCEERGIISKSRILVIICLYSTFKYRPDAVDSFDIERNKLININRKLSHEETRRFSNKLEEIKQKRATVDDLLSFVILAYANEEDSEFVRNVVLKTIQDMDKRQKLLLTYLAILKYYSDAWLPRKVALNFAYGELMSTGRITQETTNGPMDVTHRTRKFSPEFESLVAFEDNMPNTVGGGSFWSRKNFVHVSHSSVAFNILKALVSEKDLGNTVRNMLSEKHLLDTSCQRHYVHDIFRILLTKRSIDENESNSQGQRGERRTRKQGLFSKVIEAIMKLENREKAVSVLECAYGKFVDDFMKAHIAQTIARIYRAWDNKWEDAKKWATTGVEHVPENFAIRDTLGQVYKDKLRNLTEAISGEYYVFTHLDVLHAHRTALAQFRKAQKLFNAGKGLSRRSRTPDHPVARGEEEDDDSVSDICINTPHGIIETNLMLVSFLLKSRDLAEPARRESILKFMVDEDRSVDVASLFCAVPAPKSAEGEEEFDLRQFQVTLLDVFPTTLSCIDQLTRKLSYVDLTDGSVAPVDWMRRLGKQIFDFGFTFGMRHQRDVQWSRVDSPRAGTADKLVALRRILQAGIANSFGWISRAPAANVWKEETKFREYRLCLARMIEITRGGGEALLLAWDKICYVNVAFAIHICNTRRLSASAGLDALDFDVVRGFVKELVEAKVTLSPDPYFFYTAVFFPETASERSGGEEVTVLQRVREEELHTLVTSHRRLLDFKQNEFCSVRARYVFYLGAGRGLERFLPGMGSGVVKGNSRSRRLRLRGRLNDDKDVVVALGGGGDDRADRPPQVLVLKNVKPFQRNKPVGPRERVSFSVAFTYAGLAAIDVTSIEPEFERQKLQALSASR